MTTAATIVLAPAKLTRSLRVTGVRPDGMHEIDAEMVALDLADELTIHPGGSGLTVTGAYAEGVPCDDHNLIARALALAGRQAAVHVVKRIPPGGGLGGGSADAAAILRWAGVTDLALAATLGADVPFCLGGGRARVAGVGDVVTALAFVPLVVTLVLPPMVSSTPAVYRKWDALGGPTAQGSNDLEPAALAVEPRLVRWRDRIAELVGVQPVLAGSGSTWFVEGGHEDALAVLTDEGATVVVARTVPPRDGDGR